MRSTVKALDLQLLALVLPLAVLIVGCGLPTVPVLQFERTPSPDALQFPPVPATTVLHPGVDVFPCDSATTVARDSASMALLAGEPEQALEIHDCQRLVVDDQFGPLVGIFPIRSAVAAPDTMAFREPLVVASIYNWGPGAYRALGIPRGLSCLWLQHVSGNDWRAAIEPPRQTCTDRERTIMSGSSSFFSVQPIPDSDANRDYPATARWYWDFTHLVHYMGIRCGNSWCGIGLRGFALKQADAVDADVAVMHGWFDEQHLAVLDTNGRLVPGPLGTIYPHDRLLRATVDTFTGKRIPVAMVRMNGSEADLALYEGKRGFGTDPGTLTAFYLTREDVQNPNDGWTATVKRKGFLNLFTMSQTFDVDRIAQTHAASGVVRWRWSSNDEASWTPCDQACCTPRPE